MPEIYYMKLRASKQQLDQHILQSGTGLEKPRVFNNNNK